MKLEVSNLTGNFEKDLAIWGEEVVKYCHPIAKEIDKAFYAFQSEPKKTKYLILGLNPGGSGPYSVEKNGQMKSWNLPNGMTSDVFIHQNPYYNNGEDYNIIKKFKIMLSANDKLNEILSNMLYMNILYFNSTVFSEYKKDLNTQKSQIPSWNEVYKKCIDFSKFLIHNIIKPEIIICFSIDNCFKQFIEGAKTEELLKGRVYKTLINNTIVYGITHPSAHIPNETRVMIGNSLYQDIFTEKFPPLQQLESGKYDYIPEVYEKGEKTVLIAIKDDYCGVIDLEENIIIPFEYDEIHAHQNAGKIFFVAGKGDKWGVIDEDGNIIIAFDEYDDLIGQDRGATALLVAKKDGLWGVIDFDRNVIVPFEHNNYLYFREENENLFLMIKGEKVGRIDMEKKMLVEKE